MAGASVGTAYLTLIPSMNGFERKVNSQLAGMSTASGSRAMGRKAADGFAGGMASGGVVVGAAAAITQKAMDVISQSMGRAVARVDTMANFPKVMTNLGYSAEDASRCIKTMSDSLDGLPTSLDAMTGMVQQLVPLSANMDEATQIGLAFNNMLLAGGASTQQQQNALLQYTQALAKGKPELQDWRTLQQVMPGQLDQVAKAMLGASAKSMDLYEALKDGKVSMADFNQAILRLNTEGANGFASFEQQARDATTGIQTAIDNMNTRVAKGVATLIDTIGQENISGAINTFSSGFGGIADSLAGDIRAAKEFLAPLAPMVKTLADTATKAAPNVIRLAGAFALFKGARSVIGGVGSLMDALTSKVNGAGQSILRQSLHWNTYGNRGARAIQGIGSALRGMSLSQVSVATVVVGSLAYAITNWAQCAEDARNREELLTQATSGMGEAVQGIIGSIDSASGKTRELGECATMATVSFDEFLDKQAGHAQSIMTIRDSLNEELVTLNSAQSAISELAGKTDLTTQEQGRLKAAIDMTNEALGTNYDVIDAANGVISDSQGNYDEAKAAAGEYKDEIYRLIEAKKTEARAEAIRDSLKEAYAAKSEAAAKYADAVAHLTEVQNRMREAEAAGLDTSAFQAELAAAQKGVDDTAAALDSASGAVDRLEGQMGDLANATSKTAGEFVTFANDTGFESMLSRSGHSVTEFATQAREAGISVKTMQTLSSQQLATLANNFDGSSKSIVDSLAAMGISVEDYNAIELLDKDAIASIDDGSLIDAQGNVYTWNGSDIVDQYGNAVVDGRSLVDAQGRVWTWNSSTLKYQQTGVSVDTSSFGRAQSAWQGTTFRTKFAEVIARVKQQNAAGGFVKTHASGGFVTSGVTNLGVDRNGVMHVAGEDGIEWVMKHADGTTSIVPIQNRKYLEPYASVIASMIGPRDGVSGSMAASVLARMSAIEELLAAILAKDGDVYMSGERVSEVLAREASIGMMARGLA